MRYARPKDHDDKVLVAMIESVAAIADLPEMLEVEGIDVFFLGPNDLSHSMGYAGADASSRGEGHGEEGDRVDPRRGQDPGHACRRRNRRRVRRGRLPISLRARQQFRRRPARADFRRRVMQARAQEAR